MSLTDALIPLLTARIPFLNLEQLYEVENHVQASITSQQPTSKCPKCGTTSSSLHSHYTRTIQDLPVSGSSITWILHVRRFRCRKRKCSQHIFCERFTQGLNAYARTTNRVTALFETTSLHIGASPASSLIPDIGLISSPSTMLRRAHQAIVPDVIDATLKIIGVDDFAFQRGLNYGTIIVNHENNKVVDLLPDRVANTLSTWLKSHPTIEIITRDRSFEYGKACTDGAPQAKQVLDRWHILKNLRDALEHLLERHRKVIAEVAQQFKTALGVPVYRPSYKQSEHAKAVLEMRCERILRARALFAEYQSVARVAFELPGSRTFVAKAIKSQDLPELGNNARSRSLLEPWLPELEARFTGGLRNARQFWRELQAIGFLGSYERVHDWVRFRRDCEDAQQATSSTTATSTDLAVPTPNTLTTALPVNSEVRKARSFMPCQLVWLLMLTDERLCDEDRLILERLSDRCLDIPKARVLALEFQRLMFDKDVQALSAWFTTVKSSILPDLVSFVTGLERERAALEASISEVWSNGRTEGHVNKLKLIKRQGYGQAGFELLRKRVLLA
jgi:transposase